MNADAGDVSRWVLPRVLEEQARARGDQPFVSVVDGATLSFRQLADDAARVAAMLSAHGATAGDRIAVMLPSNLDLIRAWAGIGRLGAVAVMLNTELTGAFLAHPLADCGPRLLILHADFRAAYEAVRESLPPIERVIVVDDAPGETGGYAAFADWTAHAPFDGPLPAAQDLACIMYTSGTTGPPKGVLMPHAHCFLFGLGVIENLAVGEADHYYIVLPLYHANGLLMQLGAALIAGGRATVRPRFSASNWLEDIRASGATITHTLGAISAFILATPPGPRDRDHGLRLILAAPNHPDHERGFRERYGVPDVVGAYGMTEVNIPLYGERGRPRPGTCGRPYARRFEVEIRDPETDLPVPAGQVGEIMVRPRAAGAFMAGYHNRPDQTLEAWRNLWFHTGDAGRMDEAGYVTFVDRIKDCIRRRGENISAADIEASFADLPGVAEISAYAVASEIDGGEDEIMIAVVTQPGARLTAGDIAGHALRKVPRFARPRFVEFRASLPKTGTEKVRKIELKEAGVTPATIDLAGLY